MSKFDKIRMLCVLVVVSLSCGSSVQADYVIKNGTSETVYVSICWFEPANIQETQTFGLTGQDKWRLRGWIKIEPNKEVVVLKGDIRRFGKIYYYAQGSDTVWNGKTKLRVHPKNAFKYGLSKTGDYYVVREGTYLTEPQPGIPEGSVLKGFREAKKGTSSNYRLRLTN